MEQPGFSITRCYTSSSNNIDQKPQKRKLRYANNILRGSSMYSFTLTISSHDNKEQSHQQVVRGKRLDNKRISRTEECHSLSPVQHPVVVGQCDNHYGPYHNLPIHDDRSIFGCVHPYHFHALRSWGSLEAQHNHAPSTADWGRLMMGVPYNDPNTPPLELSINSINQQHAKCYPDTMHAHGKRPSGHVFECQLIIPCLLITRKEHVNFS